MPGRRTGRRWQNEYLRPAPIRWLLPQRNHIRRLAIEQARRLLARERNRPRPILFDLGPEPRHVDRCGLDLVIHPGARLGQIGKADPELQQRRELARLIAARRDPGLVERAPKAVAGMGVVVPDFSGARAGGGADEDEAEARAELVGEAFDDGSGQITRPQACQFRKEGSHTVPSAVRSSHERSDIQDRRATLANLAVLQALLHGQ